MKQVKGYTILQKQELKELNATGYLLEHDKTKAKVAAIETTDAEIAAACLTEYMQGF